MARKRANGEGKITYLPGRKSPWRVAFPSAAGGYEYSFHRTDEDAKRKLRELQRNRDMGLVAVGGKQTLERYLATWLEEVRATRAYNTYRGYEVNCRRHIIPAIGKVPLGKLTPDHIKRITAEARELNLASRTVGSIFGTLHSALAQAYAEGTIAANPCDRVKAPSSRRNPTRFLDEEEVAALTEAARGRRLEALFALALATGMRRGELLGVRWADIEWQTGRVYVERNLQREPRAQIREGESRTELVSKHVKTDKSHRHIPVSARTLDALQARRQRQRIERAAHADTWHDQDLVFTTRYGTPITFSNFQRQYGAWFKRAGVAYVRPHDLRHTAATHWLASGEMEAHEVAELLGHANVNLVYNLYGHVMPKRKRKAAAIMDAIMYGQAAADQDAKTRERR